MSAALSGPMVLGPLPSRSAAPGDTTTGSGPDSGLRRASAGKPPSPVERASRAYAPGSTASSVTPRASSPSRRLRSVSRYTSTTPVTPGTFRTASATPFGRAPADSTRASAPTDSTAARSRASSTPASTEPPNAVVTSASSSASSGSTVVAG
ncbi:hypothetical protein GTW66_26370, partial [Streptomyces sp. SID5473]|nr:hypothetical protein [Streptomyces sp. SID5473]